MSETIDRDALHGYVQRVLMLHVGRAVINQDLSAVYEEAKSAGLVPAIIRQVVRERQMKDGERTAHYGLLDSYRRALGLLADTPLGEAALERAGTAGRPRPFAEQPLHRGRGRPRKDRVGDTLSGLDPLGAA